MQKSIPLWRKLLLICVGLFFAFCLVTLVDRFLNWYLNTSGYFLLLKPGLHVLSDTKEFTVTTDISSQGLRNQMVQIPKPNNVYRILAVGDSFTFGWGVKLQQTWIKQLEQKLHIPGKKIEIVNAAAPGMELADELLACKAYAGRMQADAVLIGVNSTEDFAQRYLQSINEGNETIWQKLWPTLFQINKPIIAMDWLKSQQNSVVTSSYWSNFSPAFAEQNPTIKQKLSANMLQLFLYGEISPFPAITAYFYPDYYTYVLQPQISQKAQSEFAQKIAEIKQDCIKNRPAAAMFIPSEGFISQEGAEAMQLSGFTWDKKLLNFNFDNIFKPMFTRAGIEYMSPLQDFRKNGCPDCFYPIDEHPTATGDAQLANYAYPFVEDLISKKN
ncbi:MAG TPA: hypothetical protein VF820_04075 [Patescibacteria group bacterium]